MGVKDFIFARLLSRSREPDAADMVLAKKLVGGDGGGGSETGHVPSTNVFGLPAFSYRNTDFGAIYINGNLYSSVEGAQRIAAYVNEPNQYGNIGPVMIGASTQNVDGFSSYTYDGRTVYYKRITASSQASVITTNPECILDTSIRLSLLSDDSKAAWSMIYEGVDD